MALVSIAEFSTLPIDVNSRPLPIASNPTARQKLTPTASSAQSTAFAVSTHYVRISTDVAIHLGYGATATSTDLYVPAGSVEFFAVTGGTQLAFILAA